MALYPIWKDYYVIIGDQDKVDFSIYVVLSGTRTTIYQGTAYRKPGDSFIRIRINDICADWLAENLGLLDDATLNNTELPLTFIVSHGTGEVSIQFVNDWSYDYARNVGTDGMSDPIDGRAYWDMPLPFTSLDESLALIAYMKDGTPKDATVTAADILEDCKDTDFGRALRTSGCFTALLGDIKIEPAGAAGAAFDFTDLEAIEVQSTGAIYRFVDTCARYALYYVNAYGGWDVLLMDGTDMERDELTRHEASRVYDNTDRQNRGTVNHVNEVQKSWTLHTGYLTDEQSGRMHHLLNSVQVYLYDMEEDAFLPVVLTGTSTEYKTYRNQGRKLVSYEIQARLAQDRIRR